MRHLGEVYDSDGQYVADEDWISYAVAHGWPILTQDEKIRYRAHERDPLLDGHSPLFYLTKQDLPIAERIRRFHSQQAAIYRAVDRGVPAIYGVYEDRLVRKWP